MKLADVDAGWLRAWVDAGYMTMADYLAELKRREEAAKAAKGVKQ